MEARQITVDPLSFVSVLLHTTCNDLSLSQATGFFISKDRQDYLITNGHVLAGRNPQTNKPLSDTAALPDEVSLTYHVWFDENGQRRTGLGRATEQLKDAAGKPRWHEHPDGAKVDVVALPVANPDVRVTRYPLDLALATTNLFAGVGETVSIIGYPFGLTGGGLFPVWKTGHIASEPEVDYDDSPVFLVDATARPGMSGSPVVRRFGGFGYRNRGGFEMIASSTMSAGRSELTRFMGVYSGRLRDGAAEVGMVWKPEVIEQILGTIPSS